MLKPLVKLIYFCRESDHYLEAAHSYVYVGFNFSSLSVAMAPGFTPCVSGPNSWENSFKDPKYIEINDFVVSMIQKFGRK